jgi:hypothetical protein
MFSLHFAQDFATRFLLHRIAGAVCPDKLIPVPGTAMLVATRAVTLIRLLLAAVQLAVAQIELAIHTVALAIHSLALTVQLRAALIGDTRALVMITVMTTVLLLIDLPVAPVEFAVHTIELPMHLLALTIERLPLAANLFVLLLLPHLCTALVTPGTGGLGEPSHHHQSYYSHPNMLGKCPFHIITPFHAIGFSVVFFVLSFGCMPTQITAAYLNTSLNVDVMEFAHSAF